MKHIPLLLTLFCVPSLLLGANAWTIVSKSSSISPIQCSRYQRSTSTALCTRMTNSDSSDLPIRREISPQPPHRPQLLSRVKEFLTGKGLTKEKVAKLGAYGVLSYAFVSNMSYITCVIISWIIHGKATGLSPLAKGQWKAFLGVYAGLWAANNVLRPARFTAAVAIAPSFDKLIEYIERRTGFKRATCVAITVFMVNVIGSCAYLFFGLLLATTITRVPLLG